jgi:hypothetical protein
MELLNPWIIEIQDRTDGFVIINIISRATGEIRQINLSVNDINAIHTLENQRILKAAEIIDEEDGRAETLDELLGYVPEESID